jgi:glutamine amidotransferase
MGNLWSVQTAVEKLGYPCQVTSDASEVSQAKILILPGVGSFHLAMLKLKELELDTAIRQALDQDAKILGVCLGMQLMCRSSTEDIYSEGLGLIDLPVDQISHDEWQRDKITHIGFNTVTFPSDSTLAAGFGNEADFYFVHSYSAADMELFQQKNVSFSYSWINGRRIVAAFESRKIYGVQFHPEKSQSNGLRLIANFLSSS